MPCSDCVAISAELAAQKAFMVKWFDVFMKEFQEAKVQAQEFRQEIRHKFDILGAGENFAHNNLAVKCSEDVGLSEGNKEGCSKGLSFFNEFLEEPPHQCCLPTQGREEEFCETSSSNVPVPPLAVVKEETSPNDGELGSVDVIPEIGPSGLDQSSRNNDVAWTDQPMLDESDLFVRAQEFSSKGKSRESFLQMKEQQRRLNISKKLRQRKQAQREAVNNGTEDLNGFACRLCSSVVRRTRNTMDNHAAIHLDFMAFKCPHCNYKAVRCGNVDRHIQKVHRTIPNPMPTVKLMSKEDYKLRIKNKLNQCFPNCKPTKLVD